MISPFREDPVATTLEPKKPMRDTLEWLVRRSGVQLPRPVFGSPHSSDERFGLRSTEAIPETIQKIPISTLIVVAVITFTAIHFLREVVLPLVLAIMLSFILRGPVRWMRRQGIRLSIAAGLVVLLSMSALVASTVLLAGPARSWVTRLPTEIPTIQLKLRRLTAPLGRLDSMAVQVQSLVSGGAAPVADAGATPTPPVTAVAVQQSSGLLRKILGNATSVLITIFSVMLLTFLLLASGDLFLRKLSKVLPVDVEATTPYNVSEAVEAAIATYLRTVIMINAGLGLATWGVLSIIGVPNAGLWGTVAGLLNFIPYFGAFATLILLSGVALTVFDTLGAILLVPAAFGVLNIIESHGVTPLLMGRQLPLNPVALVVGVIFWNFLWGVPGAILAVPLMVTAKIVCDAIPPLSHIAEFLGS